MRTDPESWRKEIESALMYDRSGHYSADDVISGIRSGDFQMWPGESSVVITQLQDFPRRRALCFFIVAGALHELQAMYPALIEWGRSKGCTTAFLVGRRGWAGTFLKNEGWTQTAVVMEREL